MIAAAPSAIVMASTNRSIVVSRPLQRAALEVDTLPAIDEQ